MTGQTAANNSNGDIAGRVNVEIMVPLKDLTNFWRALEIPLINCEVELILNSCYIHRDVANEVPTFTIIRDKSLYSCSYFINSR